MVPATLPVLPEVSLVLCVYVVRRGYRRIASGTLGETQIGRIDSRVRIGVEEHCDRMPLSPRPVDDTMQRRTELSVSPAVEQIADVAHECAGNRLCGDPFTVAIA